MKTVFLLFLLLEAVYATTISYKGITEEDQPTYTLDIPYSYALDRLNQRSLPLDRVYYNGAYSGKGITVYIVDTGMSSNRFYTFSCGYNFVDDNCDCSTSHIHGTHVGSLVGSTAFGVAPDTTLVNLKVLDDSGAGLMSTVIEALDYLLVRNVTCSIINMSIGGGKSNILNLKIEELVKAGNRVVVAAGNSGVNACDFSPSSASYAITVGAVCDNDKRVRFSNRGKCVDIYAPGCNVIGSIGGDDIQYLSGTSMSSPLITGVLALQMERKGCIANLKRTRIRKGIKIGFTGK